MYPPREIFSSFYSISIIILSTIIEYFIQLYDNSWVHIGAVLAISQYTIATKLISKKNFRNVLTAVITTYILECLIQLPLLYIIMNINPNFDMLTSYPSLLAIMIGAALLSIVLLKFFPIKHLYEKVLQIPSLIALGFILFLTIIGVMSYYFPEIYMPSQITMFAAITFLFLAFFFTFFFTMRAQKKEQAVHYYESYLPILDDMILNIRKTQHNYNNTIQALASLPQVYTDPDALAVALEEYAGNITQTSIPTAFLHFDNKLLTALLYNKYCLADKLKIKLYVVVHNYFYTSRCNEFQTIDLTGILLDNAIEASQEGDTIYVEIGAPLHKSTKHGTNSNTPFTITVKNPGPQATEEFIKKIFSTKYTSKTENGTEHGLGLPYVKSLTQQYKGHIEVYNETFTASDTKKPCNYFVISVSV